MTSCRRLAWRQITVTTRIGVAAKFRCAWGGARVDHWRRDGHHVVDAACWPRATNRGYLYGQGKRHGQGAKTQQSRAEKAEILQEETRRRIGVHQHLIQKAVTGRLVPAFVWRRIPRAERAVRNGKKRISAICNA